MSELRSYIYNDEESYAIGELNGNNYIDGFGYMYWADSEEVAMGTFTNGQKEGWILSSAVSDKYNERVVYFQCREDGKLADGVGMVSYDTNLQFNQTTVGKYEGYSFNIFKSGGWRYQYSDESGETRIVEFFADTFNLVMGYYENKESVWQKQILNGKLLNDYRVPFHLFKHDPMPNASFEEGANYVQDDSQTGAFILQDDEGTYISNIKNGKYHGILYEDVGDKVSISQYKAGGQEGGSLEVYKDTCNYVYTYYIKGILWPIRVYWFANTGTLEVRRYVYKDPLQFDTIVIDKNFNVTYLVAHNYKTKKAAEQYAYDYEDVYKGNVEVEENSDDVEGEDTSDPDVEKEPDFDDDDRPCPKPKPKKPAKGKKTSAKKPATKKTVKKADKDTVDWADKLKDLFK